MDRKPTVVALLLLLFAAEPRRGQAVFPACLNLVFSSGFEQESLFPWSNEACLEAEPNNTSATANAICSTAAGSIVPAGDHDFYRLAELPDATFTLETNSGTVGQCNLIDTKLTIRNSVGALLLTNDDGGVDLCSLLTWALPATGGPYFADVEAFSGTIANYGLTATVSTPIINEIEPNDTLATATPYCSMLRGRITPIGDVDYVAFPVINGQTITAETNDGAIGTCSERVNDFETATVRI